MEHASDKKSKLRRLGVFGDLPTRLMLLGLKVAPPFIELAVVPVWTLMFFLIARSQRGAVAGNLRVLFPKWSRLRAMIGAYRVFLNFAFTFVDAMRYETGTGAVDWKIEGRTAFDDLAHRSDGCLILTAHMGNYDMAAPLFSDQFGRTIYAVRAPEREPEMQALREAEMRRKEERNPYFRTLYNDGGNMLGIELARLLNEGNVVAVQGDRVVFEVSPMETEVEPGLMMKLPRGPLYLARVTAVTVFPLFIMRRGWRSYKVEVHEPLVLPPRIRGATVDSGTQLWAGVILEVVRRNWQQWFVFEPVFRRKEEAP